MTSHDLAHTTVSGHGGKRKNSPYPLPNSDRWNLGPEASGTTADLVIQPPVVAPQTQLHQKQGLHKNPQVPGPLAVTATPVNPEPLALVQPEPPDNPGAAASKPMKSPLRASGGT